MSFNDWCQWARDQDDPWLRIADIAEADAKYADARNQQAFQEDIGTNQPTEQSDYENICWEHPLKGRTVDGSVPSFLTRCKTVDDIEGYQNQAIEQVGHSDLRKHSSQRYLSLSRPDPQQGWQQADDAFSVIPELEEVGFHVAHVAGEPEDKAVFATPKDGDDLPPSDDHEPALYETIQEDRPPGETDADCAVYRLALAERADQDDDYVLLYYQRGTKIGDESCFYPVPPDAAFTPQFKPVRQGADAAFGRTCPDDYSDCDDARSEPELVHPNEPVPVTDVWIRSLDNRDQNTD